MLPVIQTQNLTKYFGETAAADDISLTVDAGEVYGFLGLNGAGKTTTIRLLLGMIKPDSGIVRLFGQAAKQGAAIWNEVGYLVETPYAYPELTVRENLEVMYLLRGLKDRSAIADIIDQLQLTTYKDRKAKYLSLGNKQRLGLAKALLHEPKLLILDEPVNGLDPAGIASIRAYLKYLAVEKGTTIFLSSHILSEIAKTATRIGIIHDGKLIKEISTHDLEEQTIKKLMIDSVDNMKSKILLEENGFTTLSNDKGILEISDPKAIEAPEVIAKMLVEAQVPPKQLYIFEEDLEAYFLRIIGKSETHFEAANTSISGGNL